MSAILNSLGNIIDLIVNTFTFIIRFFSFVPDMVQTILVYVAALPVFIEIPIVATIWCAFLRAYLSHGGASS